MKTNILFISHEASYTGAPIVLLHLLRWVNTNTNFTPIVLLQEGGPMQSEFEKVAKTILWRLEWPKNKWVRRYRRIMKYDERQYQKLITSQLGKDSIKLIYANTIVTARLAVDIAKVIECPVLCHVHELQLIIQESIGNNDFIELSKHIQFFVGASLAVAKNLNLTYNIPQSKIQVVHEFVPIANDSELKKSVATIKKELNIPEESLLIVSSGTLEWRKAPELIIQVAQQVKLYSGQMPYFLWVGGNLDSHYGIRSIYDLNRSDVSQYVQFIGYKSNVKEYINACDIFMLTSREDSYPLVCLEAASFSKPILCFADSGGMPEFVEDDCGIIVPYLRTDLLAKAVLELRDNKEKRLKLGRNAADKMKNNHTVDIAARQILNIINHIIKYSYT